MKFKWHDLGVICAFFGLIVLVVVSMLIRGDNDYSGLEKRYLTVLSDVFEKSFAEGDFQDACEDYLADQLPGRTYLLEVESLFRMTFTGEDQDIYLADDGFLIQKVTEDETGEQLRANEQAAADFLEYCQADKSIDCAKLMVVPTKSLILRDKLDEDAPVYDQEAVLDELKETFGDSFVDVRSSFENGFVSRDELYYKTDHHWTMKGAAVAAAQYLEEVGKDSFGEEIIARLGAVSMNFYGTLYSSTLYPLCGSDTILSYPAGQNHQMYVDGKLYQTLADEDALDTQDQYNYYMGGNYASCEITGSSDCDGNLLIIRDSYANCFVPFLTDSYRKIYMVDLRYYHEDLKTFMKENDIDSVLILYNADNFLTDTNLAQLPSLTQSEKQEQSEKQGKARQYMDELLEAMNEENSDNPVDTCCSSGESSFDDNIYYLYQIDDDCIEDGCFAYASDGLKADEISIIKPADGASFKVKQALKTRITRREDDFRAYVPEEAEKIGNGLIFEENGYIFLIITDDPSGTEELIKDIFQSDTD